MLIGKINKKELNLSYFSMGTHQKCLAEELLITTLTCFHGEITKISVLFGCKNVPYCRLFLSNFFTLIHNESKTTQTDSLGLPCLQLAYQNKK